MTDTPTDRLVTVFGGSGFLGRYAVRALAQSGYRIRVAVRRPDLAYDLQPLGRVGQIHAVQANVRYPDSVMQAAEGAETVVNLVGIMNPRGAQTFDAVQAEGAEAIAEAARKNSAKLVHISAIGADPKSGSAYARTKAAGEQAALAANAVVLRPSIVFGPEDDLTNRLAALSRLPVLPVVAAKRRFQPVYVKDLARAITMAALDPRSFGGQAFEIGGPQVMTMEDIYAICARAAGREPDLLELPNFASSFLAMFGFLPGAPLTRDQWKMLQRDNLPSAGAQGLEAFGIEPTALGAVAPEWLQRFREGGRWSANAVQQAA